MSTTRRWICLVAFTVTLATFASAAPPLLNNADVKEVLSKPSQDIRRFDGTVVPEERPTSRNTIRRKRELKNLESQSKAATNAAIRDENVLAYVTAMREYSEAAYLLLGRMKAINETFGADALSSGIVDTLKNESEFEALKKSLQNGDFNPLALVQVSARSKAINSNKSWERELRESLFYGFSRKALESNVPWDNILYEPEEEEEFMGTEFQEMFAKWDLGYSVAKYLWKLKIQRKEPSLKSTVTNAIIERLEDMCQDSDRLNETLDYLQVIEYLQKNETIFVPIHEFQYGDELAAGIVALIHIVSSIGRAGNTINPYTKGSDVYNSIRRILELEMKRDNITSHLDLFIRRFVKFVAFSSEERKTAAMTVLQPAYKAVWSYFQTCESLDKEAIENFARYMMETLTQYSQISKSSLLVD